jgi:hypothetical protein
VPVFFCEVFSGQCEKCGDATIAGRLHQLEGRSAQCRNEKGFLLSSDGDSYNGLAGVISRFSGDSFRKAQA